MARKGKSPKQVLENTKQKPKIKLNMKKRNISLEDGDDFHVSIELTDSHRKTIRERQRTCLLLKDVGGLLDATSRQAYYERRLKRVGNADDDPADLNEVLVVASNELQLRVAADALLMKLFEYPRRVDLSSYERALFTFPALAAAAKEDSQFYVYKILKVSVEHAATGDDDEFDPDQY